MASSGRRFSSPNLKQQNVSVTLVRDGFGQPWGFRLAGGADLGMPLTVQRALAGTPSEGELKPGDIITKIGDRDARHLSHKDAQHLFKNAGNNVTLQVQRGGDQPKPLASGPISPPLTLSKQSPVTNGGHASPVPMNRPLQVQTALPPAAMEVFSPGPVVPARGPQGLAALTSPPAGAPLPNSGNFSKTIQSPVHNLPVTTFPPPLPGLANSHFGLEAPECIDMQPYRTTPLVLPGAKVKREVPTTSYLQHHPNPAMRANPQHYDPNLEVLMKQKVMHKQFNSPIGLYSEDNIADSVQAQTGVTPYKGKKTLYYDPAKSETFKALKDSELGDTVTEVPEPIQPKVFTPQKHIQPPLNQLQRQQQAKSPHPQPENLLGDDKIHQSYSFRRLMNEVLGESDF
ncbi:PDZ and LIM domain protein 3 isoform X10 [Neocloeon triangulifer]|uniref:PDZ and LIM domain protein 3 isoform X10 n=1 Tax=Neocloeon triangulifer TaxID=2078957 RepID=UPI00286F3715|nr:PDZ and LIM domain protein 3 isoform X10 [Neocloeon triangulifer]